MHNITFSKHINKLGVTFKTTTMRYTILVLILTFIFSCDNDKKKENYNERIIINARIVGNDILTCHDSVKRKTFDINLSIINKSIKPISFYLMSCSWEDNFIVNNDYIDFKGHSCDKNFPRLNHLKSNDSIVLKTTVIKYEMTRYQNIVTTKFGLVFIDTSSCKSPMNFDEIIGDKSKHDKIIWSNALNLNDY